MQKDDNKLTINIQYITCEEQFEINKLDNLKKNEKEKRIKNNPGRDNFKKNEEEESVKGNPGRDNVEKEKEKERDEKNRIGKEITKGITQNINYNRPNKQV
jgi:hypothetical protein